ncbi:hypothetical protein [Mucilaginibacter phyllosphaerae]
MTKHYGKIVEYIIRKNGYSLTQLATELKVNRRTMYNWFQSQQLKTSSIQEIGLVIRHDFSNEFPELFVSEDFQKRNVIAANNDNVYKDKYIELLEKHNNLLTKLDDFRKEFPQCC